MGILPRSHRLEADATARGIAILAMIYRLEAGATGVHRLEIHARGSIGWKPLPQATHGQSFRLACCGLPRM